MGLTDSQEQTKIDKFKSIVVKKVHRKIQLLMTTMEKYQPLVVKWPNFRGGGWWFGLDPILTTGSRSDWLISFRNCILSSLNQM